MIYILIKNAQIVTVEDGKVLNNSAIAIFDNKIVDIGDSQELSSRYLEVKK